MSSNEPSEARRVNLITKSLNKRITYFGIDRSLFWIVLTGALSIWTLFENLVGAVVMGGALLVAAKHATETDPEILRILLLAAGCKGRYDPLKYVATDIRVVGRCRS